VRVCVCMSHGMGEARFLWSREAAALARKRRLAAEYMVSSLMAGEWQPLVGPLRLSRRRLGCAHHGRHRVSLSFIPGIIVLILGLGFIVLILGPGIIILILGLGFGRRRLSQGIVVQVLGGRIVGEEALGEPQRGTRWEGNLRMYRCLWTCGCLVGRWMRQRADVEVGPLDGALQAPVVCRPWPVTSHVSRD